MDTKRPMTTERQVRKGTLVSTSCGPFSTMAEGRSAMTMSSLPELLLWLPLVMPLDCSACSWCTLSCEEGEESILFVQMMYVYVLCMYRHVPKEIIRAASSRFRNQPQHN